MLENRPSGPAGRRARWLLILSFLLLMALTTVTVSAQGTAAEPDPLQPTNETGIPDETLRLEPTILSETRSGDATNITIEIPVGEMCIRDRSDRGQTRPAGPWPPA